MHIDSFNIQLSTAVGMKQGSANNPLIKQDDIIDSLRSLLSSCGWAVKNLTASGTITYPLGFPTVPNTPLLPKRVVGCWSQPFVSLDGATFTPYNPYTEVPAVGAQCNFFALDTTTAAGISNLCVAISALPRYSATSSIVGGVNQINITGKLPGPTYNFPSFSADGRWGTASQIAGGGYEFTSQAETDSTGNLRTSQYTVRVTAYGSINSQSSHITYPVVFDFQTKYNGFGSNLIVLDSLINPVSQFPTVLGSAGYLMVANPYSFACIVPDAINATGIFAASPYIPTEEDFTSAYTMFAVAYPTRATYWPNNFILCADGPAGFYQYTSHGYPRMLALKQPGTAPLLTPSGTPVITNSWIMYAANSSAVPYVMGKLWDCAVINDYLTQPTVIGGFRYYPIARQDGSGYKTRATLLFRTDIVPTSTQGGSNNGGTGFPGTGGFSGGGSGGNGSGGGGPVVNPGTASGSITVAGRVQTSFRPTNNLTNSMTVVGNVAAEFLQPALQTTMVQVINANTATPELVWVSGPQFSLTEVGRNLFLSKLTAITNTPGIDPTQTYVAQYICWALRFGMIDSSQLSSSNLLALANKCSLLGYAGNCIPPSGVMEWLTAQREAGTLPAIVLPDLSTIPAAPPLTGVNCGSAWTLSGLNLLFAGQPTQLSAVSEFFTVASFIDAQHVTISPGINGYLNGTTAIIPLEQLTWQA